jgi:hypothetical protein
MVYVAVAAAGYLNSYCMRMGEMDKGIKIYDEITGEEMGISKDCARSAVLQTAGSRILLSAPTFIIPGVTMFFIDKLGLLPVKKVPRTILDLAVIGFALGNALPLSVSLFPQRGEISASKLEPEFRNLTNSRGQHVEKYFYNKGL